MKLRVGFIAAFVVLSLAVAVVAYASHSWNGYHWGRTSNPFTLKLGDNMSSAWDPILGAVSGDWSLSTELDTTIVPGGKCKATTGTVQVCSGKYGFNGWLGLATIWIYSDGHIARGTAKVNDTYFNTSTYNNSNAKRHVLCQEVGHTLGLGHQTAVSCMDDRNGLFDSAYVDPNQHDFDQLASIYSGHTDSSSTVAAMAASGNGRGAAGEEPEDAVPPGAGPENGNVFVRDLGGGRLMITFVFWVEPGVPDAGADSHGPPD